jgi:Mrp family chromosome partitioning ATPase
VAQLALSLDRRTEDALLPGALAAGHAVVARVQTAGELAGVLAGRPVDLAIVSASRMRLTAELRAAAAAAGTRLVALAASDDDTEVARAAGVPEIVAEPASWDELEGLLRTRAASPPGQSRAHPRRPASVLAVWGPTGAPGRTSLAISLAAELADAGATVALVDADTYGGAVAPWLGLPDEAPGFAAACRLVAADGLTRAEFDRVAHYVPTSRGALAVLTGIGRPSRWPELGGERVTAAVEAVSAWFDHVVVDVGFNLEADEEISSDLFAPRRNAATLAVLGLATRVVAVGLADPVGLSRLLRGCEELGALSPGARLSLVVNRVRSSVVGPRPEAQIAAALERFGGVTPTAFLPDDPSALDAAMRSAAPLARAAPRSALRAAIRAFVEAEILGLAAPAARPRRLVRRRAAPPASDAVTRPTLDWQGVDAQ